MRKFIAILLAVVMVLTCLAGCEEPNESGTDEVVFPSGNTLTIIVPVSAGAGMDVQARIFATYLSEELGTNVVIENIDGGGTVLGATEFLTYDADDDYMIYLSTDHAVLTPVLSEASYTYEDFTAVSTLTYTEEALWVRADSPWETWEDVVAASQIEPIVCGTGAKTGPAYIAVQGAFDASDANFEYVIASSVPESIINMVAGTVDLCWSAYTQAQQYYETDQIKPIVGTGVTTDPQIGAETMMEKGYDFSFSSCNAFFMNANADPAIIAIMEEACANVYANPDFQADFEAAGNQILADASADFANEAVEQKIALLPMIEEMMLG